MSTRSIGGFFVKLRLSDPFRYKIPFLISIPYLFLAIDILTPNAGYERFVNYYKHFINTNDVVASTLLIFLAIMACIGFAGFGYATNDWSDIKKDQLAGKPNSFAGLSVAGRVATTLFFLALAFLPWLYLKFTAISIVFIVIELALFSMYAFPPFRLKEKGIWGVLTDALYAHTVPALFAAYTFYLLRSDASSAVMALIISLAVWQTISGIRNILLHQLDDHDNDVISGNRTFVVRAGKATSLKLTQQVLIPAEVLSYLAYLLITIWATTIWLAPIYIALYALLAFVNRRDMKQLTYRKFCYLLLDDFYLECIPICMLLLLCLRDVRFLVLVLLHILIFQKNIFRRLI